MGRAPLLIYDGSVTIGQSKTIERFVAKKLGFMGSSDEDGARIDMICEHIRDIKQKYNDSKSGKKDEVLAEAKSTFINVDFPKWLAKLEKCLDCSGYAIGDRLSLADISIQQLIQDYFDDKEGAAKATEGLPKISASVAVVATAAEAWFASRPATAM